MYYLSAAYKILVASIFCFYKNIKPQTADSNRVYVLCRDIFQFAGIVRWQKMEAKSSLKEETYFTGSKIDVCPPLVSARKENIVSHLLLIVLR